MTILIIIIIPNYKMSSTMPGSLLNHLKLNLINVIFVWKR